MVPLEKNLDPSIHVDTSLICTTNLNIVNTEQAHCAVAVALPPLTVALTQQDKRTAW